MLEQLLLSIHSIRSDIDFIDAFFLVSIPNVVEAGGGGM